MNQEKVFKHFIIVGLNTKNLSLEQIRSGQIETQTIYQKDSLQNDTQQQNYLQNFSYWLFPQNPLIFDSKQNPIQQIQQQKSNTKTPKFSELNHKIMHFVMTDEHQIKRFCSSLMVYQHYMLNNQVIYIPIQICLITQINIFAFSHQLLQVFTQSLIIRNTPLYINHAQSELYEKLIQKEGKHKGEIQYNQLQTQINKTGQQQQQQQQQQTTYEANDCLEFYISFLLSLIEESAENNEYKIELLNNQCIRLSEYGQDLCALQDNSLKQLLQVISLQVLTQTVLSIVLEKQVILISDDMGILALYADVLLRLMEPLQYQCMYIPYLPAKLNQVISAIGPFLVGMTKSDFNEVQRQIDIGSKTVLDLDNNQIYNLDPLLTEVGGVYTSFIYNQLQPVVNRYLINQQDQLDIIFRTEIKLQYLNMFLLILDNYFHYFRPKKIELKQLDALPIDEIFDTEAYLKSFVNHKRHSQFLSQLTKTMCFNTLIVNTFKIYYFDDYLKKKFINTYNICNKTINFKKIMDKLVHYNKGKPIMLLIENKHILKALDQIEYDFSKNELISNYNKPTTISLKSYFVKYIHRLKEQQISIERIKATKQHDQYNLQFLKHIRDDLVFDIKYIYKSSNNPNTTHYINVSVIESESQNNHQVENINKIRTMNSINIQQYQKPKLSMPDHDDSKPQGQQFKNALFANQYMSSQASTFNMNNSKMGKNNHFTQQLKNSKFSLEEIEERKQHSSQKVMRKQGDLDKSYMQSLSMKQQINEQQGGISMISENRFSKNNIIDTSQSIDRSIYQKSNTSVYHKGDRDMKQMQDILKQKLEFQTKQSKSIQRINVQTIEQTPHNYPKTNEKINNPQQSYFNTNQQSPIQYRKDIFNTNKSVNEQDNYQLLANIKQNQQQASRINSFNQQSFLNLRRESQDMDMNVSQISFQDQANQVMVNNIVNQNDLGNLSQKQDIRFRKSQTQNRIPQGFNYL